MKHHVVSRIAVTSVWLSLAGATAGSTAGAAGQLNHGALKVGRTGIFCYAEPCPWHGVGYAKGTVRPNALLWSGDRPPPMSGRSADLKRIRDAYLESCTIVNARFADGVLEVSAILGSC